jgi:hypothetical protein
MRSVNGLTLLGLLASGCIIYEEDLDGSSGDRPGDDRPGDSTGDSAEPEVPEIHLWLDPAGAVPGDVAILALYGDGQADLSTITDVSFFGGGGIAVVATDTRGHDEFLLTIDVPEDAALGSNDLLVQFADGTAVYVDLAFDVVAAANEIPAPDADPPVGDCP